MRITLTLCLCVILLLYSCSTPPKGGDKQNLPSIKNSAAEYTSMANTFFFQGQYQQALKYYKLALDENMSINNEAGIIKSYNDIGKIYSLRGEYNKALTLFDKAYSSAETLQDTNLLAQSEINIGEVFLRQGNSNDALQWFNKALARPEDSIDLKKRAILFHNTGQTHKHLGNYANAQSFIREALEINLSLDLDQEIAGNYYALASVASKEKKYGEALEYAQKALAYDKNVENSIGIGKDLLALGIINEKAGNDREAYIYYQKSYDVFLSINLKSEVVNVLNYLISITEILNFKEERQQYIEMQKSLLEAES